MANDQERLTPNQDNSAETYQSTAKQLDKISDNTEKSAELSPRDIESRTERARVEALKSAVGNSEKTSKHTEQISKNKSAYRHGSINNKQRSESYTRTLKQVQDELPLGSRLFSKITHAKAIEKTSDFLGSTVARPDAMLSGAFFAFILTLLTYITAKTIGYALSGFETIAAFILGWIIGIIYDYLHVLFTGKKN